MDLLLQKIKSGSITHVKITDADGEIFVVEVDGQRVQFEFRYIKYQHTPDIIVDDE